MQASKLPNDSSLPKTLRTNLNLLRDIAIYDEVNQPQDNTNPCFKLGNGQCEQLCFSFPQNQNLTTSIKSAYK